jgi:hypothetical protein
VTDSQIARIKRAEEAAKGFLELANDIRQEADRTKDHDLRKELLETAEGFEVEARKLVDALRDWREDIQ